MEEIEKSLRNGPLSFLSLPHSLQQYKMHFMHFFLLTVFCNYCLLLCLFTWEYCLLSLRWILHMTEKWRLRNRKLPNVREKLSLFVALRDGWSNPYIKTSILHCRFGNACCFRDYLSACALLKAVGTVLSICCLWNLSVILFGVIVCSFSMGA